MKYLSFLFTFFCFSIYAQDMHYPELDVTPRASERVAIEVLNESSKALDSNLSIMLSGLMSFSAGALSTGSIKGDKAEGDKAPGIAMGIGAFWLGVGAWSTMRYRPYKTMSNNIKKLNYKTKREQLITERLAEEEINQLAKVGRNIRWFSAFTNLFASAYLLENIEGESDAQVTAGLSTLVSLLPLIFNYHWEDVAYEQRKYKKKIYAPLTMAPLLKQTYNGEFASGLSLAYHF